MLTAMEVVVRVKIHPSLDGARALSIRRQIAYDFRRIQCQFHEIVRKHARNYSNNIENKTRLIETYLFC
jgi:hypothetical protein